MCRNYLREVTVKNCNDWVYVGVAACGDTDATRKAEYECFEAGGWALGFYYTVLITLYALEGFHNTFFIMKYNSCYIVPLDYSKIH